MTLRFLTFTFFVLYFFLPPLGGIEGGFAQTPITKVRGKITDAKTGEPVPYVNVAFRGTRIGTATDFEGNYLIETYKPSDSLLASCIGYKRHARYIVKNKTQTVNFALEPLQFALPEVVVKYKGNPAIDIFKEIVDHKRENDRDKFDYYQYEVYNKVEIDMNNISEKFMKRKILKPFSFVFDNLDTNETNAKVFLPVFLAESVSDFYYRKNPRAGKEVIRGSKVSGVQNESVTQFMGQMYQNIVNIYNNYVEVFGRNFVSPISDFARVYYKFYLTDSAFIGNSYCFRIKFEPRNKHEPVFKGEMWIHDTTYALVSLDVEIAEDVNLNFIQDLRASQRYARIGNKWMLEKEVLMVDLNLGENQLGFYGKKTTTYRNHRINEPQPDELYQTADNLIVKTDAFKQNENYWDSVRHEPLTENESAVYVMVDSIRSLPIFQTYIETIAMFITGYKPVGKVEFGPYYTFFSFNRIEGPRLRLGGRTSNAFSTKVMLYGHLAYGFSDHRLKYRGGFLYFPSKKTPRISYGMAYENDLEQVGQSSNAFLEDNILASVFRRNPQSKLTSIQEYQAHYEREWYPGFSNKFFFLHRVSQIWKPTENSAPDRYITTSEVTLYTRFAKDERYIEGEFERMSVGTTKPVLQVQYTLGVKDIFNSEYEYHKVVAQLKHRIQIGSFGYNDYILEAGRIFSREPIPYPLLELHKGNETRAYDDYAFNMMNYYEFASDEYFSVASTQHFEGFFLDKFPILRRLRLREVASAKGVIGNLNVEHSQAIPFPSTLSNVNKPYFEAGIGVENILRVLRIDLLWRLSYLDHPDISVWGIRGKLQLMF
ncbi:MAG: carboxypeptidase-like regulatory domain-containing protein [Bacteroidetes bacterium]|nr:carboxypeptidase-like regulatory domain-containing protein [Bacteroidota bacterium]